MLYFGCSVLPRPTIGLETHLKFLSAPVIRSLIGVLLLTLIAGCGGTAPTPIPAIPTTAPVSTTALYWDMGVSVKYPSNWAAPLYGAGQVLLAPSVEATTRNPPTEPLVALQFATLEQLRVTKDTTLEAITAVVSGQQANSDVKQRMQGKAQFAGLDAFFVELEDAKNKLYEQTIAFRMPDGRIGWIIGLTPRDIWANFAPSFDQIRASGTLIKPTSYVVPKPGAMELYPQGGLSFALPEGWISKDLGGGIKLYHHKDDTPYQDGSGLSNGPQLVLRVRPLEKDKTAADALLQMVSGADGKPIDVTVGGQAGAQLGFTDPNTRQQVSFIGVPSQDKSVITILRWTTPTTLTEVTQPLWDALLKSITLSTISATLVPASTSIPPVVADSGFYKGITQSSTSDGAFIVGNPDAPVRVVEFLDYSCPHCREYESTMHSFIDSTVRAGKASVEMRYMTFVGHEYSVTAATAALCAGETGKQAELHDRLFDLQYTNGLSSFTVDALTKEAVALGADQTKFAACMTKGKADVLAAADTLARTYGVEGTPTLMIGKRDSIPQPLTQNGAKVTIPSLELLQSTVDQLSK